MQNLFIIRDDDLNYFSKISDIEFWYQDIFSKNIPVGFSVIPYVKSTSDVFTNGAIKDGKEYPIHLNKELVDYIKNNPLIEIFQHGCTHETVGGIFEYLSNKDLNKETTRGKIELESTFVKEISIFVSPHDQISNKGIKAIEKNNMNIIRSKGSRNFLFRKEYLLVLIKMVMHRLKNLNPINAPAFPYVVNFRGHKEVYSHRISPDLELMKKWLHFAKDKNANFVLVTHLHYFTKEEKNNLNLIIKEAGDLGFTFGKAEDIFYGK